MLHLVHDEVGSNGEEGNVAQFRKIENESAPVITARSGKENPGAHKGSDIGHDQYQGTDGTSVCVVVLACFDFLVAPGVDAYGSHQNAVDNITFFNIILTIV